MRLRATVNGSHHRHGERPRAAGHDLLAQRAGRPPPFDGTVKDVNGNGRQDIADIVPYFDSMSWIAANDPVSTFDHFRNRRIDFEDVVRLSTSSERRHSLLVFAGDGRMVLLGVTERLEFVDAPGHAADLERYRARGYSVKANHIRLVIDRPRSVVEVHPPSRGSVDLGGLTVERCPTAPAAG